MTMPVRLAGLATEFHLNLAILQARMSSTRLPGKVLEPILGQPMIARQVERLRRSARLDALVVATSLEPSDDPVAAWARSAGVSVHRGALNDVLERFCGVLAAWPQARAVVRLTADCPLADWTVIDELLDLHRAQAADYSSNVLPERTFPHGLDAEIVTPEALLAAHGETTDPYDREHVTPFVYRRPERFRTASLTRSPSLAHLRWTVDLPSDLAFVRQVYGALYPTRPDFGSEDVVALNCNSAPIPA
jgi:spore coat polysaccharide biosynthesis protein SpsF